MKRVIFALLLTVGAVSFAHARPIHRVNCTPGVLGCPSVAPKPAVSPVAPAAKPAVTKDVFSDILQFQQQIIADLQMADTTQASPINPGTGQAWNPAAHMCLAGVPAQGTVGQPGYVAAMPGLISFVQSFPSPSVSQVPALPAGAGPATIAVHAQNVIDAALLDASALENTITNGANSKTLQGLIDACGAAVNTTLTEVQTVAAQGAAVEAILAKFVVPLAMAHKSEGK